MFDTPAIDRFINSYDYNYISSISKIVLMVFSGNNHLILQNTHLNFKKDYVLLVPPCTDISFKGDGEVYICIIPIVFLKQILSRPITRNIAQFFNNRLNSISIFDIKSRTDKYYNIFNNIQIEVQNRDINYMNMVQLHIIEVLILLRRTDLLTPDQTDNLKSGSYIWRIKDVIYYINNNFDSQFTLNELAGKCALNPSYFSRSFKLAAGIPLFEYINRLRIEKACHLLKVSNSSIIEIAFSVGYNNVSFFNRYFKKIMNISPGEYRNRIKK